MLPMGTTREYREACILESRLSRCLILFRQECEEVTIPPAKAVPPRVNERLIPVVDLDGLAKGAFPVGATSYKDYFYA